MDKVNVVVLEDFPDKEHNCFWRKKGEVIKDMEFSRYKELEGKKLVELKKDNKKNTSEENKDEKED